MTPYQNNQEIPLGYNKVNFFVLVKFVEEVFNATENKKARTPDKDGKLIHAEISIGDSMILVADSKEDWLFTTVIPQVFVLDAQEVLNRAMEAGAKVITPVSDFYYGLKLARFQDSWEKIW